MKKEKTYWMCFNKDTLLPIGGGCYDDRFLMWKTKREAMSYEAPLESYEILKKVKITII